MLFAIACLIGGFYEAALAGKKFEEEEPWYCICFATMSIFLLALGAFMFYNDRLGNLIDLNKQQGLEINAIYETLGSIKQNVTEPKYAVILKDQSGNLIACSVDKELPKMFKFVEGKNRYQIFPSAQ